MTAHQPTNNSWPLQRDCDTFYGNPRDGDHYNVAWAKENLVGVHCPWALSLGLNGQGESLPCPIITIHKKCAESLERVLHNIWEAVGQSQHAINNLHYERFSGSFSYRLKRGGNTLSMHGYGCAVDWDAEENPFHVKKGLFTDASLIVVKFKEEGACWGGDWSENSKDFMHMQFARVHP